MAIPLHVSPASQESARRHWKTYNEHRVQRGQLDIYLQSLEHWDDDLRSINAGKAGHPFTFAGALFFVACMLRFLSKRYYRKKKLKTRWKKIERVFIGRIGHHWLHIHLDQ